MGPQWDPSGTPVGPLWTPVGPRCGRSGPQWDPGVAAADPSGTPVGPQWDPGVAAADPSGTPGAKCCYFIGFNRVLMILGVEMLLFHWF